MRAALVIASTLLFVSPASAEGTGAGIAIKVKAGRLDAALRALATQSGIGVLFSPDVVGDRSSRGVAGTMRVDEVLRRLLDGSGLWFRRTPEGAIIVYSVPAEEQAPSLPVPEILVVGKRTQNADIRRTENDIQPYQVATAQDVTSSHADNVDQFLRERLPNNAQPNPPSLNPNLETASNRSEVNLHGLGANQTLILIDGARMPRIPSLMDDLSVAQPDLNGLPVSVIDRIETLTGTAGGIYGPGATGGVVNVVLKRDYRGADLGMTFGLSDRGDAARGRVDARLGFTPDHGRSDVMIALSRSQTRGLRFGRRDYAVKARQIMIARDPIGFLDRFPSADAFIIRSIGGDDLTLRPGLGGASLGSSYTFLPIDYPGVAHDGAATLLANAGHIPSALSQDGNGAQQNLTNDTDVASVLLNLRHRFGDGVEAFVDLIGLQNNSHAILEKSSGSLVVSRFSATNPFLQDVSILYPQPGISTSADNRLRTIRLSAGLIINLPHAWKAAANFSTGGTRNTIDYISHIMFQIDPAKDAARLAFGDSHRLAAAIAESFSPLAMHFVRKNGLRDASLRLAGPLLDTGGGTATLTLLAEHRREAIEPSTSFYTYADPFTGKPSTTTVLRNTSSQTVASLYGELRAPIVDRHAGPRVLRGLELQLALRYDDTRSRVPDGSGTTSAAEGLRAHQGALAYTAGLRIFPQDHIMLRASLASGLLPPTPSQLLSSTDKGTTAEYGADPRRGGAMVGSEGAYDLLAGGFLGLRPETARTLSFGTVLNPDGRDLPRISLDFTRIRKRGEIGVPYSGATNPILTIRYLLDKESLYPGRITRAPLTAADAAAGFTGGIVTRIDAGWFNIGQTDIDALDLRADYDMSFGSDVIRIYGAATWQLRMQRRNVRGGPVTNYIGFADGPLKLKGNAGIDWVHGRLTIGANGQYYDRYNAANAVAGPADTARLAGLDAPGVRVPAQVYFDLSAAYRLALSRRFAGARRLELRFGIQNLFDRRPPIVAPLDFETSGFGYGYSSYGDARRRRFEATIAAHF